MATKSFSFKNIFLGVLLGIITVAGLAFYPQIKSAVQSKAPVAMAKISELPAAEPFEADEATETTDSVNQKGATEESPPSQPSEQISPEIADVGPGTPPSPEAGAETAPPESKDTLDVSPGWNPEVAKAMLDTVQSPPPAASRDTSPPVAKTETPAPVPDSTPGERSTGMSSAQQEEILWQALLAGPFFADRAENYPFAACFQSASEQTLLPLPLLLGLAAHLSNFEPGAVDGDGLGILQLAWPRPAKNLGIESEEILLGDPCLNISTGSRHLASLLAQSHGKWVPALAAYRRRSEPAYLGRLGPKTFAFPKIFAAMSKR